jgi:hypothetical protein
MRNFSRRSKEGDGDWRVSSDLTRCSFGAMGQNNASARPQGLIRISESATGFG